MDATWGVVIVAVVGVAGTVLASLIQNQHARTIGREQRGHESALARRIAAHDAYLAMMSAVEEVEQAGYLGLRTERQLARLRVCHADVAVRFPPKVAAASHALADAYSAERVPANRDELKDEFTEAVRDALDAAQQADLRLYGSK